MDEESAAILHLSDLHFGAKGQNEVWESFVKYVKKMKPRPQLALVTGDIVDTPKEYLFKSAISGLERLNEVLCEGLGANQTRVLSCPGNHDRHPMGNVNVFFRRKKFYDGSFGRKKVSETFPIVVKGKNQNRWKLWVAQVDTSEHARISAQGYVGRDDLDAISNLSSIGYDDNDPFTLVILMMHHHVLPIASIEPEKPTYSGIFSFTAGSNPGRVLKSLTNGHVDLALHGHEHQQHAARYALYTKDKGEVAVVGAGSATGMHTLRGCATSRASFNVIELRPDRSVWLNVINGPDEKRSMDDWEIVAGSTVELLNGTTVRRNRFLRSLKHWESRGRTAKRDGALGIESYSEWERHVTLTRNRDAIVRDRKTNWSIENELFAFVVSNETGLPVLPEAWLYRKSHPNERIDLECAPFARVQGRPGTYAFEAICPSSKATEAHAIETSFEWRDAILLTQGDVKLLPEDAAGGLRSEGLEFVAAFVRDPLASLTLTISFPVGYRPSASSVFVYVQNTRSDENRDFILDSALRARLQIAGETLVLNVPYPLIDYRYAIAWHPPEEPGDEDKAKTRLVDRLLQDRDLCNRLATLAFETFASEQPLNVVTASLYLPYRESGDSAIRLRRVAIVTEQTGDTIQDVPPSLVSLTITNGGPNERSLYRRAWWGEPGIVGRQNGTSIDSAADQAGLLRHESLAVAIPAWNGEHHGNPFAIFRIGVVKSQSTVYSTAEALESLGTTLEKVQVRVLHELAR